MKPHFLQAYFPTSTWNGTSQNKTRVSDVVDPGPEDYTRIATEIMAVQEHLNALLSRLDGDVIQLVNPVWDDLRTPVTSVKVPAARYPDWVAYKGSLVLAFGDQAVEGNEELVYFTVQMPHNWKPASDIKVHVHWTVESEVTANVAWKLTYSWANINGVFPTESDDTVIGATGGGGGKHILSSFVTIAGANKSLSSMLLCSLRRNSSNSSDTLTGVDALLLEIDFHYQIDRFGSRYEASH